MGPEADPATLALLSVRTLVGDRKKWQRYYSCPGQVADLDPTLFRAAYLTLTDHRARIGLCPSPSGLYVSELATAPILVQNVILSDVKVKLGHMGILGAFLGPFMDFRSE